MSSPGGYLSEDVAREIFAQTLRALHHCHRRGIYHGDIKPENILLHTPAANAAQGELSVGEPSSEAPARPIAKLCDFGSASLHRRSTRASGSLVYAAPEVVALIANHSESTPLASNPTLAARYDHLLDMEGHHEATRDAPVDGGGGGGASGGAAGYVSSGRYDYDAQVADVWSLGVLLYVMLAGRTPFSTEASMYDADFVRLATGRFSFPSHFSPDAQRVIRSLLRIRPRERVSLADLSRDNWVTPFSGLNRAIMRIRRSHVDRVRRPLIAKVDGSSPPSGGTPKRPVVPRERSSPSASSASGLTHSAASASGGQSGAASDDALTPLVANGSGSSPVPLPPRLSPRRVSGASPAIPDIPAETITGFASMSNLLSSSQRRILGASATSAADGKVGGTTLGDASTGVGTGFFELLRFDEASSARPLHGGAAEGGGGSADGVSRSSGGLPGSGSKGRTREIARAAARPRATTMSPFPVMRDTIFVSPRLTAGIGCGGPVGGGAMEGVSSLTDVPDDSSETSTVLGHLVAGLRIVPGTPTYALDNFGLQTGAGAPGPFSARPFSRLRCASEDISLLSALVKESESVRARVEAEESSAGLTQPSAVAAAAAALTRAAGGTNNTATDGVRRRGLSVGSAPMGGVTGAAPFSAVPRASPPSTSNDTNDAADDNNLGLVLEGGGGDAVTRGSASFQAPPRDSPLRPTPLLPPESTSPMLANLVAGLTSGVPGLSPPPLPPAPAPPQPPPPSSLSFGASLGLRISVRRPEPQAEDDDDDLNNIAQNLLERGGPVAYGSSGTGGAMSPLAHARFTPTVAASRNMGAEAAPHWAPLLRHSASSKSLATSASSRSLALPELQSGLLDSLKSVAPRDSFGAGVDQGAARAMDLSLEAVATSPNLTVASTAPGVGAQPVAITLPPSVSYAALQRSLIISSSDTAQPSATITSGGLSSGFELTDVFMASPPSSMPGSGGALMRRAPATSGALSRIIREAAGEDGVRVADGEHEGDWDGADDAAVDDDDEGWDWSDSASHAGGELDPIGGSEAAHTPSTTRQHVETPTESPWEPETET